MSYAGEDYNNDLNPVPNAGVSRQIYQPAVSNRRLPGAPCVETFVFREKPRRQSGPMPVEGVRG